MTKIIRSLLLLSITIFINELAAASLDEHLSFKLSFENGLTPEIARGSAKGEFLGDPKLLHFPTGLAGQGFASGIEKQSVRYQADGNINSEQGTLVFFVKGNPGEKWNVRDRIFHIFFQWADGDTVLRIYKYHLNPWTRLMDNKEIHPFPDYREDVWNCFALTWEKEELKWYLNGDLIGFKKREKSLPATTKKGWFELGQSWGASDRENRVMDEFSIYDRALLPNEIMSIYAAGTGMPTKQLATVSQTGKKVTVDGEMLPDEWQDAAAILLGLDCKTKSIAEKPTLLYLMYDRDYLYFYMKSPFPRRFLDNVQNTMLHGMLKRDTVNFDQNVDFDDALEFKFNTDQGDFTHRMLVNSIEVKYDYRYNQSRRELKWNPKWQTKTKLTSECWSIEGAIPFADLTGFPQNGAEWKMNVYRIWKMLKTEINSWSNDEYSFHVKEYLGGKLIFGGLTAPQIRFDSIDSLDGNKIDLNLALRNPSAKKLPLKIELTSDKNNPLLDSIVTVGAGETVEFPVKKQFDHPVSKLKLQVSSPDGKQVYFVQETPVFSMEEPVLEAACYPIRQVVAFRGDFSQLGLGEKSARIILQIKNEDKVLLEKQLTSENNKFSDEFSIATLPDGSYRAVIQLVKDGKLLAERGTPFEKAPMPTWFGNQYGKSPKVPSPWTDLELQVDGTVNVWGRSYHYGDQLFPAAIDSANAPLLAAPIRLDVTGRDGQLLRFGKAEVLSKQSSPLEAVFVRQAKTDAVTATLESTVEYDGFIWCNLTIAPQKQPVQLQSIALSIPLTLANSTLMMPHDYTLNSTGKTKPWHGAIRPVWLGNEERGINFAAEHSANWIQKDRNFELEIIPGSKDTQLKVNLANRPFTLDQPITFEFSLMATPVKAPRADRRKWRLFTHPNFGRGGKDAVFLQLPFRRWGDPPMYETCYPVFNEKLTRPIHGELDNTPFHGLLYCQTEMLWSESPEFKRFGSEWSSDLRIVPSSDAVLINRQLGVCQSVPSYQDFMLASFRKIFEVSGNKGFYFDVSQPKNCHNLTHGCGRMVDGAIRPTFNIRGARTLMKRIYTQMKELDPDSVIAYHISGQITLPVHSFSDILLDGENFVSALQNNRGYIETLTLDTYRAEYLGRNLGPASTLLPEFRVAPELMKRAEAGKLTDKEKLDMEQLANDTNYLYGLALLHDNPFWSAYLYTFDPLERYYRILNRIDYAGKKYEFIPYWSQLVTEKRSEEELAVSFYTAPDKVVMVVMNLDATTRDVAFSVDWQKLGIPDFSTQTYNLELLEYPEKVEYHAGKITITNMPPHQYRVLLIEPKKEQK